MTLVKECEAAHGSAPPSLSPRAVPDSLLRDPPRSSVSPATASARAGVPTPAPDPTTAHLRFALLALALGGFAIGTTEFVAMGLLPQIADGVSISIPTAGHVVSAYAIGVVVGAPVLAGLRCAVPAPHAAGRVDGGLHGRQPPQRAGSLLRHARRRALSRRCRTAPTSAWRRWWPPTSRPQGMKARAVSSCSG